MQVTQSAHVTSMRESILVPDTCECEVAKEAAKFHPPTHLKFIGGGNDGSFSVTSVML